MKVTCDYGAGDQMGWGTTVLLVTTSWTFMYEFSSIIADFNLAFKPYFHWIQVINGIIPEAFRNDNVDMKSTNRTRQRYVHRLRDLVRSPDNVAWITRMCIFAKSYLL